MSTKMITSNIWTTLTAAVERSKRPAYVAVAYFGKKGAKMLPLPPGSHLVVDASEGAVKSGQTCPAELKKLYKKGVRVYSISNIHAKVFIIGSTAYIGSANVSSNSANTLVEAMVTTTDREAVLDAKSFVRDLCLNELGPEEIDKLSDLYNPPKFSGARGPRKEKKTTGPTPAIPRMLLAKLSMIDYPDGSENTQKDGRKVALKRMEHPRRHELDEFWHEGQCPYRESDKLMQVTNEGNGLVMVSPPSKVLNIKPWKGKGSFVYLERPIRKRMKLERLADRLGGDAEKKLKKNGLVSRSFARELLNVWNQQ